MNKAATNKEVRVNNQKNIVYTLFHYGPMTKQELADRLNLSLPTVSVINKNLAEKGLIARGDKQESSGGRPASNIKLVFDARLSIGIDITSSHVRVVLVNLGPQILKSEKQRLLFAHTEVYWQTVSKIVKDFIAANEVDESILLGIGLSIQAQANTEPAVIKTLSPIRLTNDDLKWIKLIFGNETEVYNNAKMASLSQVWGAGEDNDFVYLMLSSRVGGSIITDRRVLRKDSRNAEFGHMILNEDGPLCSCGRHGCLEAYCSSRALQERSGVSLEDFFQGLADGNNGYNVFWEEYLHNLSLAIHNIRLIFDTDVIIGGEMSTFIGGYIDQLRENLSVRNPFGDTGSYVRIGSYGEYDSAIGAAMIHIDKFLS